MEHHLPGYTPAEMKKPVKRKQKWRYVFYTAIVFSLLYFAFTWQTSTSDESFWEYMVSTSKDYLGNRLTEPISALGSSPEDVIEGYKEDRVNILLLGVGGKGHDGGYLTDTIILASYKPSTEQVSMLSIPRDLIIPIPGYGWRKVNNLYSIAEVNDPGTGGDYTKQILSQIFDEQIPYYIRLDFKGFTELIDLIGGVDVEVPNTLSDYQYPIPGREEYPEDEFAPADSLE